MLEYIILSVMLIADCSSNEKVDFSLHENTTSNNPKTVENVQSFPQQKPRRNFEDSLTLPTSDPPDFMESYNLGLVTTASPDKFSIIDAIPLTTTKTVSQEYWLTKFSYDTPKLPTHPHYTFTTTPVFIPTESPYTFWSKFFSAGFQNSKNLELDDVAVSTTADYGHPPTILLSTHLKNDFD